MGDRVSIRFVKGTENDSPVLFSHWGGREFARAAQDYADALSVWAREDLASGKGISDPLHRLEPRTVTVDFIYQLGRSGYAGERVTGDLYLERTEFDGDNSDNGHFDIELAVDTGLPLFSFTNGEKA